MDVTSKACNDCPPIFKMENKLLNCPPIFKMANKLLMTYSLEYDRSFAHHLLVVSTKVPPRSFTSW